MQERKNWVHWGTNIGHILIRTTGIDKVHHLPVMSIFMVALMAWKQLINQGRIHEALGYHILSLISSHGSMLQVMSVVHIEL